MSQKVDLIKVFISCPNDVDDERKIIREICKSLSNVTCSKKNIEVKPIDYKENIIPLITHSDAQAVIDVQLDKEKYDIYIGILWHRFGDPRESGMTPTESEFHAALERYQDTGYPSMQFYFKCSEYAPSDDYEKEQLKKVELFKLKIQKMKLGMYKSFMDVPSFQNSVYQFLHLCVERFIENQSINCPVSKISYSPVKLYLSRSVVRNQKTESEAFFHEELSYDLVEVVKEHNKVVLVGDAGIGKTSELGRIANYFSDDNTTYYPFFVSLNTYMDQKIEDLFNSDWNQIPLNLPLFILDGFDEIESKFKKDFIKRLELFCEKNTGIHVLISCRSNFYMSETNESSGLFKGFKSVFLKKLDHNQISEYSKQRLGFKSSRFIEGIKEKKIDDLLTIPFYLIELINLFESSDQLPDNRASIIDKLIASRLNFDVKHFKHALDLEQKKEYAVELLQDIALIMEALGRNYITESEYQSILPNENDRELLSHCTAWKNQSNFLTWQFENNNIQEYLAAQKLRTQRLSVIQSFVAFGPKYGKIIPSWVNTISFLISIYETNDLIEWLLKIEPEIIIKFEPERIEESRRIQIAKDIFNFYRNKRIWINTEKFRYGELGNFCNSIEVVDFLIGESHKESNPVVSGNAIQIISEMQMKLPYSRREIVQDFLMNFMTDDNSPDYLKGRVLSAFDDLNLVSEAIADKIVKELQVSTNDSIRYRLYQFLHTNGFVDRHISVFLEGIKYIDTDSSHNRLLNESMELIAGLEKASKPETLKSIIAHIRQNNSEKFHFLFEQEGKYLKKIVENLIQAYRKDPLLYQDVMELLVFVDGKFLNGINIISKFFIETKTQFGAFKAILEKGVKQYDDLLSILADEESLEYITQAFRANKISHDDLQFFLHCLEFNQNSLYEDFFRALNTEFNDSFEKKQYIDFQKIRKEQKQRDIELLFDKDAFIKEVELIFTDSKLETLNHDYFSDLQFDYRVWPKYAPIVIRELSSLTINEDLSLNQVLQTINSWGWEWFWIKNIYDKLKGKSDDSMLSDTQKQKVITWCYDQLTTIDFKKAIKKTGPSSVSINLKETLIWFFYKEFELEFQENILLDMISFDYSGGVIPFLEGRFLDVNQMAIRILDNIYKEDLCRAVLENHLKFCQRHKIADALEFAFNNIVDIESDLRNLSLNLICELSENLNRLMEKLPFIDDDFKWKVVERLVESKHPKVEDYLNLIFSRGVQEEKYKAAIFLIRLQKMEGIRFYLDYLKKQKIFTSDLYYNSPLGSILEIKAVPLLLDLYEACLKKEIKNEDKKGFERLEGLIENSLKTIALTEDNNFFIVKTAVEAFIDKHINSYDSVKWLYHFIEQTEMQHYINKSKNVKIEDAISKVQQLKQEHLQGRN